MIPVNMKLLPMKAHYFLYNAGTAPVVPFIPTIARQLGFSATVVGIIYAVLPIMGMIVKPTMGAVADRYKCQKALFLAFMLLIIVSFFPLLYVPNMPAKVEGELHCHQISSLRLCGTPKGLVSRLVNEGGKNSTIACKMQCEFNAQFVHSACVTWNWTGLCDRDGKPTLNILSDTRAVTPPTDSITFDAILAPYHTLPDPGTDCLFTRVSNVQLGALWHIPYCDSLLVSRCRAECDSQALQAVDTHTDTEVLHHYQFWLFTLLLVFSWIGMAVVVSVGDAICFSILGEEPSKFGYQRLWGSLGFGVFVVLAGWLIDYWSSGNLNKDYTPVFYIMALMLALDFLFSTRIQCSETFHTASILRNVGRLFTDIQVLVFMLWLVVVGMCTAVIWNFLLWYLEELAEKFGQSSTQEYLKTLEGLVYGVQCFGGEIPFFFLSGWILKKIGHIHAMSLILFAFGIRFLLYSTLTNPWWCLPIEMLNGLTFGLLYATMASHASLIAPLGTDTTVQGLVGAIFEGIGVSSGSFLAGLLFNRMSGAIVFRTAGLTVLVICVLHICAQFFLGRRHIMVVAQGGKDFNRSAHYASPNEAINMLDEPSYEPLT